MQEPHLPIRIAISQLQTDTVIGALGDPLFSAVRASPLSALAARTKAYEV
jgi:hypothetical protein